METIDEILFEVKKLSIKLYGEGTFQGDIPEIKACFKDHSKRIRRIEITIAGLLGTGIVTGGITGLIKLLG